MKIMCTIIVLMFAISSPIIIAENGNGSAGPKDGDKCANIDLKYNPKDATVLFTGFLLPTETQDYIAKLQQEIKAQGVQMDDTVSNKLHMTLRFIGFVAPADFEKVKSCLKGLFASVKVPKIALEPTGFHMLKNRDGTPRMLLAKFDAPELQELFKTVNEKVEALAGKPQHPSFLAHITIGTFNNAPKSQNADDVEKKISSLNQNKDIKPEVGNLYLLGLPTEDLNDQYQNCKNYDRYYQFKK